MSLDFSKYMFLYDRPPDELKDMMFIGSVDEPHDVVPFDIIQGYHLSPLFNTIISLRSRKTYTIHHIDNNQVFSKSVNYYKPFQYRDVNRPKFFFSYDGKMIAEVSGNSVHILNSLGDLLVERDMPLGEESVAITNEYLITYHTIGHDLHFWSINDLSGAVNPSFAINTLYGKEISPNIGAPHSIITYIASNVRVIMGENNSFLLTRNIMRNSKLFATSVNEEMVYEWTKYRIQPYTTMDQFYDSLKD